MQASMQRVYEQRKVKHATCKNVKGRVLEDSNTIGDTDVFGMVPIGGAIVHPRWWRLQPTKGNGCASPRRAPPTKGPRRSNLVYPTMAIAHEGLASLAVDLHEVGDLLALTNSLVQLHNLVGGSQVTPSQSRRHHSPRSNKWCVDDELLALVLQMIVSPTLNSLS